MPSFISEEGRRSLVIDNLSSKDYVEEYPNEDRIYISQKDLKNLDEVIDVILNWAGPVAEYKDGYYTFAPTKDWNEDDVIEYSQTRFNFNTLDFQDFPIVDAYMKKVTKKIKKNPVEERALNVVVVKSKTIAVNAANIYNITHDKQYPLANQIRQILDHKRVLHPYGAISGAIPNKLIKKDEFTLITKNKRGDEFRVELIGFDPSDTKTFWETVEQMEAHIRKEENPVEDLPSLAESAEKIEDLEAEVERLEEEVKNLEAQWESHSCYSEEYSSAVERIDDADESLETLFYELRSLYEGIHLRKQTISLDELKRLSSEWMRDVERIRDELSSDR